MAGGLFLLAGGFATHALTQGQEPPGPQPVGTAATASVEPLKPARDLSKLTLLQQQMYRCAQRGGDWLHRANRPDGRFVYGYVPDLNTPLEGDHYLRQVGAAYALARAARFLGEERYAASARQAVLTLLLDTAPDADDPQLRHTMLPSLIVNRLAAAGLLVLAIQELPAPGEDLLEQSEQLCAFIRRQQAGDGSLSYVDANVHVDPDPEAINTYPGVALYALMRSQRHRPEAWKTDLVRKALPYYRSWWRAHQSAAFVPWQTLAYTEAFLQTREQPFADVVNDMNDWLCNLQYVQLDPRHPHWSGGFMDCVDGKQIPTAPQVSAALYAESLGEAGRVARRAGDLKRLERFRDSQERALQFVATLQYTEGNTQHFETWYRRGLLGAFHASHQDGTMRIDYTQVAVCALVEYLTDQPE
jgi:hypothetical protein